MGPIPLTTYDVNDDSDTDLNNALEHFVSPNLDDVKSEAVHLYVSCVQTVAYHIILYLV